jgi:hypothetical protein
MGLWSGRVVENACAGTEDDGYVWYACIIIMTLWVEDEAQWVGKVRVFVSLIET